MDNSNCFNCPTSHSEIAEIKEEIRTNRKLDKLIISLSIVSILVTIGTRVIYG